MAFKLDFSKLSAPLSPEEQAQEDIKARAAALAAERRERESKVKHIRTVTMTEECDFTYENDDRRRVVFHGTDEQGRPIRGGYTTLEAMTEDSAAALFARFQPGQTLVMHGYFRPWTDGAGKTQFSFVALFVD